MAKLKHGPQRSNRSIEALFSTEQKRLFPRAVIDFLLSHLNFSSLQKGEAHPSYIDFGSPGGGAGAPPLTILSCDYLGGSGICLYLYHKGSLKTGGAFSSGRKRVDLRMDLPGMNPTSDISH